MFSVLEESVNLEDYPAGTVLMKLKPSSIRKVTKAYQRALNAGAKIHGLNEKYFLVESEDKSFLDKNHKQKGFLSLEDFRIVKTFNNQYEGKPVTVKWTDNKGRTAGIVTADSLPACDGYRYLGDLFVSDIYRGYGLGEQILDFAVKNLKAGALAVEKDNQIALRLYRKYGFKENRNRKDIDMIIMEYKPNQEKIK